METLRVREPRSWQPRLNTAERGLGPAASDELKRFKKEEVATLVPVQRAKVSGDLLAQLHADIDQVFGRMFRAIGWPVADISRLFGDTALASLKPHLDIAEMEREYVITVEVQGVEASDLQLKLLNDTLLIRGEKRQEWSNMGS